ncbi:MAG: DUF1579 domain-containing protein [Actinomycetota bacterium]
MQAEPQKEHQWLQRMVGEWTSRMEMSAGPEDPGCGCGGTEVVRSIGGVWVQGEGTGEMPDGNASTTIITLGYDPQKQRFVGTFIGSMMTNLWVYEGELNADGTRLTLDTEGPDFAGQGKIVKYQDIIEFRSDDHRVMMSQTLGDDGEWHPFMTAHYHRVK